MIEQNTNFEQHCPQPVDRLRRFRFIAILVFLCLILAAVFTGVASFGVVTSVYHVELIADFIGASMGLATAATLGYITGSVVDYNGLGGMLNRGRRTSVPTSSVGAQG